MMKKLINLQRRKDRVRAKVFGTAKRPRLSVYVSNKNVSCQLIDDDKSNTVVYSSSSENKELDKKNLSEKASWVGSDIAQKAKKIKISSVVFDRNGRLYHGRIKALADAARSKGLKF